VEEQRYRLYQRRRFSQSTPYRTPAMNPKTFHPRHCTRLAKSPHLYGMVAVNLQGVCAFNSLFAESRHLLTRSDEFKQHCRSCSRHNRWKKSAWESWIARGVECNSRWPCHNLECCWPSLLSELETFRLKEVLVRSTRRA